jgi:predicted esterase
MNQVGQIRTNASPTANDRKRNAWVLGAVVLLLALNLVSCVLGSYHKFVTVGESRALVAGVYHWKTWDFELAGEAPPLARMLATLAILPSGPTVVKTWDRTQCHDLNLWSRLEDRIASDLAVTMLPDAYLDMVRLARLAGYSWWLVGAWLIFRWARGLYGVAGSALALILWTFGPNVIAAERAIDSSLPAAVTAALTTYYFRLYLHEPNWRRAIGLGLLLGIALLIDFLLIGLLVSLSVPWSVSRLRRIGGGGRIARDRTGIGRAALVALTCLWMIHSGYGLESDWHSLKDFEFDSHALSGKSRSEVSSLDSKSSGNRFEGYKIGDLVIPVPADYVRGFDRWLAQTSSTRGERPSDPLTRAASIGARIPLGILAMILWATVLLILRRERSVSLIEELTLWTPVVLVLCCMEINADLVPPERGLVLIAPFAIVGMGRLGRYCLPWRWKTGSLVLLFTSWAVVSSLMGSWDGRTYLNEAAGGPDSLQAHLDYGSGDGGADLLALKAWVASHPEARSLGIAVRNAIDLKPFGLARDRPPINPGADVAIQPGYDPHFGPFPGYYALDLNNLKSKGYSYFRYFQPIAKIGSTIAVYNVTTQGAERVRRDLGLPPLEDPSHPPIKDRGFLRRDYRDASGDESHYTIFVPYAYTGDRPYPLILFLHGFGDRGTEGEQYLKVGLPVAIKARQHSFGFITLFPQGRNGSWTPDSSDANRALAILDRVEKEYNIDHKRIYLTGLSSGAGAVWSMAARYPERWAAIVPVATGGSDLGLVPMIKKVPCWCFHNVNDVLSPPAASRNMIAALRREGGAPRYTEFFYPATTGPDRHNAWDAAYGMPELYDWLLQCRLP